MTSAILSRMKRLDFINKKLAPSSHLIIGLLSGILLSLYGGDISAEIHYIDRDKGNDRNDGNAADRAWQTLEPAKFTHLQPGDALLLKRGQSWPQTLVIKVSGTSDQPVRISSYGEGPRPIIKGLEITATHVVISNIVIDHAREDGDAVKIHHGVNLVLENIEARNGTGDGIDIRGGRDIRIKGAHIHHFLAGSFKEQKDAHGIVAVDTQGLTIEDTEIHHVSGDCFQSDPGRTALRMSNDILIKNSHFWTAPLTEDFNEGWRATAHLPAAEKQYPGENAIDTKVVKENWDKAPRMRLTVENLTVHGWKKDGYITNKAAFNIKEKVEAMFNAVTVYDSELAFRLRGNRGNANVTIRNSTIYNSDVAIRAEDSLNNLTIINSIFGLGNTRPLVFAGDRGNLESWNVRNNTFVGFRPRIFREQNTFISEENAIDYFIAPLNGDYRRQTR